MKVDVKVPVLAESVAEATLMNWHKKPGETVSRGDSLIDIETDKVTLEVAAPNNGVLVEILKKDGEDVESDEVIARIDTEAAATAEAEEAAESTPQQQDLPVDDTAESEPKLSPAVRKLLEEHKLDPADIPATGEGNRLTKEDVLKYISTNKNKASTPAKPEPAPKPAPAKKSAPEPAPAKKTAAAEVKQPPEPAKTQAREKAPAPAPATQSSAEDDRPQERVPMTRLRRRAAERLLAAQHENAILTTFNEVNMQPVMELRRTYKEEFEKTHGIKLGFMSFFTRAVVEALKKFPVVNASIDGEDIVYHGYFDIGMAVSSPRGLVVPVIRDADMMSFAQIETKIREYGEKAKDSKLTIEELTGGTFTITNGGVFGSLVSTPIINPPQSAILGMHAIQERPVAENGNVVIRPMMYLALSYDHRIIDGKEAVQFLVDIKKLIEEPGRLLLQI